MKVQLTADTSRPLAVANVLATVGLLLARAAAAQQAPTAQAAAVPQSSDNAQLQEVVVTAERRNENLQTTAIAATVLDGDQLAGKGVVQIADLQNASPSLSITDSGLTENVNIRGIGLDSGSPSVVPGVAEYRDGLWQPPIVGTDTLYDIGSAEVLRGPQGTFVGANSTGGAIFINSRNPDFNGLHGDVQGSAGNYSDWGFQGAVNLPISDAWAARIATDMESRDSFYSLASSKLTPAPAQFGEPGSLDEKNVRASLLGKPDGDLTVLLKVEVNDKSTGGYAYKPVPGTEYAAYASPDPFTLNYDHASQNDELAVRGSLKVDWDINGSGLILRSLTGDQFMRVRDVYDEDGTSSQLPGPPALSESQLVIERPITQEFNLISPDTGRLQWVAGAYYMHDTREVAIDLQSQAVPTNIYPYLTQVIQNAASFGQLSYSITPALQLQVGLRYTHDWNEETNGSGTVIDLGIPGTAPIFISGAGIETDSATTGKAALNWTLNDTNFLYAFAAKGFKAGGFNAGAAGQSMR